MSNTISSKRNKVLKQNKKPNPGFMVIIPVVIMLAGVTFLLWPREESKVFNFGNTFVSYSPVKAVNGMVKIPAASFNDGSARYFAYEFPQKTVYFFALKSSDGVIRAAFDSCDVCFRARKGYRQEGDFMICNNCGQQFSSIQINEIRGGCNPAPLERTIDSGNLVLDVADINKGFRYF